MISTESNDVCNQKNKKTINAEHVLDALDRLGKGKCAHCASLTNATRWKKNNNWKWLKVTLH